MPIILPRPVRRLSQAEFGELAYSVMGCVFKIHHDFGPLFDEKIYKRELAFRHPGVQLEFPIEVVHAFFRKIQYLDVLVDYGGPFEFKAVEVFTPRHPAQLLHYMLLAELEHGKLVNLSRQTVEHEFVNTSLRHEDRVRFKIINRHWSDQVAGAGRFKDVLIALLRDWGTGLDLGLYEEAVTHLLGGETYAVADVKVRTPEHTLGRQKMRLASPRVAFALTALPEPHTDYESNVRRMLQYTGLEAMLWANISLKTGTFTTIRSSG
jgi:GxxExxY protein